MKIMSLHLLNAVYCRMSLVELWANHDRGRAGWDAGAQLTADLVERIASAVADLLDTAGVSSSARRDTEISAGTFYGMSHVAEAMHARLRDGGPKWLAPEMFVHYSPHSPVSAAALRCGLGGPGTTVIGPGAGMSALAHAARRVNAGRCRLAVVLAYEAATPFATGRLGVPAAPEHAEVAALLIGRDPGRAITLGPAGALRKRAEQAKVLSHEDGSAVAPIAQIATAGPDPLLIGQDDRMVLL